MRLMIPGPTELSQAIRERMALPMKPHYGEPWSEEFHGIVEKLKAVFQTRNDLFILAATSSAAMEMAVTHAVEPGEEILIGNNGFFGDRFTAIAESVGAVVRTIRSPNGEAIRGEQVRSALREFPRAKALAIVHNETSTAVESPLREILDAARAKDVVSIVDCVSSLGGTDVPVDGLGIDYCLCGSQKCLGAAPGLSFISVSPRAWRGIKGRKTPVRSWYLNLGILKDYGDKWQNWHPQGPNTAPVSLYEGLDQALDEIRDEGLEARFARHRRARDAFRAAMVSMGLELYVRDDIASKTLTAVKLPAGINGSTLRKRILERHDILLAGGLGETADTILRVSHMARTASAEHLIPTIEALETQLTELGHHVPRGSGARAFKARFESGT